MRTLFRDGVRPEHTSECLRMFVAACVEYAQLSQELGILDRDHIADITAFFEADERVVEFLWAVAKSTAEAAFDRGRAAAQKRLDAGEMAIVAHLQLIDLKQASRVFEKTPERDRRLFGPQLIRPTRSDGRGGWAKTKRTYTGMPTLKPEADWAVVHAVPDGPGAGRFNTAERKVMAAELGVKIDTLRAKERDLTEAEFAVWTDRRRKTMETRAKNEAERKARANRRERKPGKTAALRAFAERAGISERTAWIQLKGLSVDEIIDRTPHVTLVEITQSVRDATDICSGIEAEILCDGAAEVKRKVKRCSDMDPKNPAFLRSSVPNTAAASAPDKVGPTSHRKRRRRTLTDQQRMILGMYIHYEKGRVLTNGLIRVWKHRGVLRRHLGDAYEWYAEREAGAMTAGASFTDSPHVPVDLDT